MHLRLLRKAKQIPKKIHHWFSKIENFQSLIFQIKNIPSGLIWPNWGGGGVSRSAWEGKHHRGQCLPSHGPKSAKNDPFLASGCLHRSVLASVGRSARLKILPVAHFVPRHSFPSFLLGFWEKNPNYGPRSVPKWVEQCHRCLFPPNTSSPLVQGDFQDWERGVPFWGGGSNLGSKNFGASHQK